MDPRRPRVGVLTPVRSSPNPSPEGFEVARCGNRTSQLPSACRFNLRIVWLTDEGAQMWVVKLTDKQLEVLRAVLRAEEHLGPALRGALEALDLARWDDLPEAQLPWNDVSDAARRQGISEADVIWDLAGKQKRAAA